MPVGHHPVMYRGSDDGIPLTQLGREERRAAKVQLVTGMQAGLSWHEATAATGITTSETTAFRLRRRFQQDAWSLAQSFIPTCPASFRAPHCDLKLNMKAQRRCKNPRAVAPLSRRRC